MTHRTFDVTQLAIEIEFATDARMRLMAPVDAATVKAVIAVLTKARGR